MADKNKSMENDLLRILNAVGESVLEASEEDLDEEIRLCRQNPKDVPAQVRSTLERSLKVFQKRRLQTAYEEHERHGKRSQDTVEEIPEDPEKRRNLLKKILEWMPQYQPAVLTAQYRELSRLDDDQVLEHLKELAELGVLEDFRKKEGN